jgi:hypothetical protein
MNHEATTFDTIEGTQKFLSLLSAQIEDVLKDARRELVASTALRDRQQIQLWQLILYAATKLAGHIANSRKLMHDLETLKNTLEDDSSLYDAGSLDTTVELCAVGETGPAVSRHLQA